MEVAVLHTVLRVGSVGGATLVPTPRLEGTLEMGEARGRRGKPRWCFRCCTSLRGAAAATEGVESPARGGGEGGEAAGGGVHGTRGSSRGTRMAHSKDAAARVVEPGEAHHHSSLTTHHSPLIIHHSSLITHHSSLITHHSPLITHHSSLITHHSSLITHLATPCSSTCRRSQATAGRR